MSVVTVTGGPFTDGQGNPIPGFWTLQPLPLVNTLEDSAPRRVTGYLGTKNVNGVFTASFDGTLYATLAEGSYVFHMETQTEVIRQQITVSIANGSMQTIEALVAAGIAAGF